MKHIDLGKRVYLDKLTEDRFDNLEYMGSLDGRYDVYRDLQFAVSSYQWVHVIDNQRGKIAVDCPLRRRQRHGQQCWHPDYTRTDSRYRGQSLALRLYVFLLKQGIVLQAGDTQSEGSQKMWYKLCKTKGIEVWSVDYKGEWLECYPCDASDRVDTSYWDPYERNCTTVAMAA